MTEPAEYTCGKCGITWEFMSHRTAKSWKQRGFGPCCGLKMLDDYQRMRRENEELRRLAARSR